MPIKNLLELEVVQFDKSLILTVKRYSWNTFLETPFLMSGCPRYIVRGCVCVFPVAVQAERDAIAVSQYCAKRLLYGRIASF